MQIIVNLSEDDVKYLQNDLEDIEKWVQDSVAGKVTNCKKRMLAEWQSKLLADPAVTQMPAKESALLEMIVARPDYKNRVQREAMMVK